MAADDMAMTAPASGTLSRPKIAAAAAPTTRKQVSAIIVMAFDRVELHLDGAKPVLHYGPARTLVFLFPGNRAGNKA
ncbi:MAG TPA: hypothetical protein VFL62_02120 [Bradyrhizobium sp.]|uniref:hypothetical protein n=1 Tax=Bradyrhizobium sp. TaxID=376 RepID=UPI002D80295D|nr:hypothetical protein [Bradyrhizobium sp.]HET7885000.1 hypothetical protein [Bradyrhizobium sp.]